MSGSTGPSGTRVVTFQTGLVDMFEKHAKKGRLVYVGGKLQTRRYRKIGEEMDRFSTEILLVPGGKVAVPRQARQRERQRQHRPGTGPGGGPGPRPPAATTGRSRRWQ